jgi:hypothetical protein
MGLDKQTRAMLRAILVLCSALVSIGLVYAVGWWALLALFGAMVATFALSTRTVRDDGAVDHGEAATGQTTSVAPF